MRFAIVNGQRTLPLPGLEGRCATCAAPVIAKCGDQRIHHWAHRAKLACDRWWETETQWHRSWKQHFANDWQEVVLFDQSGEKHIADVRTPQGVTIEFQHSHLRSEERRTREAFYGEMIWVVDGLRLTRSLPRFAKGMRELRTLKTGRIFTHRSPHELFDRNWTSSEVPVFFDFGGTALSDQQGDPERSLWCILPWRSTVGAIILRYARSEFIMAAREDPRLLLGRSVFADVEARLATRRRNNAAAYLGVWRRQRRRVF